MFCWKIKKLSAVGAEREQMTAELLVGGVWCVSPLQRCEPLCWLFCDLFFSPLQIRFLVSWTVWIYGGLYASTTACCCSCNTLSAIIQTDPARREKTTTPLRCDTAWCTLALQPSLPTPAPAFQIQKTAFRLSSSPTVTLITNLRYFSELPVQNLPFFPVVFLLRKTKTKQAFSSPAGPEGKSPCAVL